MATESEILDVLETLAEYYGQEPGKVEAYFWTLEDYPLDLLKSGAKWHIKTSKWFPKASELVDACQRVKAESADPVEDIRRLYWMSQSEYNGVLNGSLEPGILRTSRAVAWCRNHGLSIGDEVPNELVQVADREGAV